MLPEELKPLLDDLKNQPEFSLDSLFDWEKHFNFLTDQDDKFWYSPHKFDEYLHIAFEGKLPDELLFSRTVPGKTETSNQELLGEWLLNKRKSKKYLELKHQDLKTKKSKTVFYYDIKGKEKFVKTSDTLDEIFNEYLQKRKQKKICIIISGIDKKPKPDQYEKFMFLIFARCFKMYLNPPPNDDNIFYLYFDSKKDEYVEYARLQKLREDLIINILQYYKKHDKTFINLLALADKVNTREYSFIKPLSQVVHQINNRDLPILLLGESGTGKTFLARGIHELSDRKNKAYVDTSFREIQPGQLEGWTKGAHTGATHKKIGLLDQSKDGTLFIDELDRSEQHERDILIRFIEEKKFTVRGTDKPIECNTKLIFGTNKNLESYIKRGLFELDFFNRIKTVVIELPPLRKRKSDIAQLSEFMLNDFNEKHKTSLKFEENIVEFLMQYTWNDNIRGLKNYLNKKLTELSSSNKQVVTVRFLLKDPPDNLQYLTEQNVFELEGILDKIISPLDPNQKESILESLIKPIISKIYLDYFPDQLGKTEATDQSFKLIGVGTKKIYSYLKKYQELIKEFEKP